MQIVLKTFCLISLTLFSSACSTLKFPGVYRIPVQQGNYLEQDMIDKLEPGLTKRQVRYIMGTPMVEDTFNTDRWDYYFNLKRGSKELRSNHFIVYFENDQLTHWDGDYTPIKKHVEKEQQDALEKTEKKENAKFK